MLLTNISLKWMVIWLRFQVCLKLGWKTLRTEFDILPLVLSANGHEWVIWWCLLCANFNNHNILSQPWNVRVSTGPDIGGAFESSTVIKKTFTFHFLFDAIRPTLFFSPHQIQMVWRFQSEMVCSSGWVIWLLPMSTLSTIHHPIHMLAEKSVIEYKKLFCHRPFSRFQYAFRLRRCSVPWLCFQRLVHVNRWVWLPILRLYDTSTCPFHYRNWVSEPLRHKSTKSSGGKVCVD